MQDVFNYSVKWSVNGQSEICCIVLYISERSAPEPTILGLLWPRSYWITDIWNCVQRQKQQLISCSLLPYHHYSLILQLGHHLIPFHCNAHSHKHKNMKNKHLKDAHDTLYVRFWQLCKKILKCKCAKKVKYAWPWLWGEIIVWHSCQSCKASSEPRGWKLLSMLLTWNDSTANIIMAFYLMSGEGWYVLCYRFPETLWMLLYGFCILFSKWKINLQIKNRGFLTTWQASF